MRTGSNLLERLINQYDDLHCHGELFNPAFLGKEGQTDYLGATLSSRERNPLDLLDAVRQFDPGKLSGFRFFDGHDPRIETAVIADRRVAKVILQRPAIESYVSLKIAKATDQWMLGNVTKRRTAKVRFDAPEYAAFTAERHGFYDRVEQALKESGQAPFVISFDDLTNPDIINGLAAFLGASERRAEFETPIKRQNPEPLEDKLENPEDMLAALADQSAPFGRDAIQHRFQSGPSVPSLIASPTQPLLFAPVPGADKAGVEDWMRGLDPDGAALLTGLSRNELQAWLQERPGHTIFSVVAHPLERAHRAFDERIVGTGPGAYKKIRRRLIAHYGFELPDGGEAWPNDKRADMFAKFLEFLKANLAGQTGIRIDPLWAAQDDIVAGFSEVAPPARVIREPDFPEEAARLFPGSRPAIAGPSGLLKTIYSRRLENLARNAYPRDYRKFGFGDWDASGSL